MTDATEAQPGVVVTKLEGRGPLNLLGRESFLRLKDELDRMERDSSVRAIILTGSGDRAFSAGVDLLQMKDLDPADAELFITALHRPARTLLTMAIPGIAAIRGPCLGGALELALACDIRIATEDCVLGAAGGAGGHTVGDRSFAVAAYDWAGPRPTLAAHGRHCGLVGSSVYRTSGSCCSSGVIDERGP